MQELISLYAQDVTTPNEIPNDLLDSVGAAFSRLRRRTNVAAGEQGIARKDLSRNLVINIVDEAEAGISVGDVAGQLSIDPSVASRMVSDCINAGYLQRVASQADGRRILLLLTDEGMALRNQFRSIQRAAFEEATASWPVNERLEFARLLLKYTATDKTALARA